MRMIYNRDLSEIREISRFRDILRFMGKEERRELVLEIWEAVNSERELDAVLAAVARLLAPVVNFQGIAIVTFDRSKGRPFALHIVEQGASARTTLEPRPSIPYSG